MENMSKSWVKDLLVAFAGTTLSIILTFGTSALIDNINRNKDRRMTALMVLSNIESSVRSLEESDEIMSRKDTLAHLLLSIPVSDVSRVDDDFLMPFIAEVKANYSVSTDKTIENIFSSNTDTWKNMGNFQFIDNVGKCYSMLRAIEVDWKEQMNSVGDEMDHIFEHPENYPGNSLSEKVLSNLQVRIQLAAISQRREWLRYAAFALRETNRLSMELVGITEEEVMAFTDERAYPDIYAENAANEAYFRGDFKIPEMPLDSMYTIKSSIHTLDSLLQSR